MGLLLLLSVTLPLGGGTKTGGNARAGRQNCRLKQTEAGGPTLPCHVLPFGRKCTAQLSRVRQKLSEYFTATHLHPHGEVVPAKLEMQIDAGRIGGAVALRIHDIHNRLHRPMGEDRGWCGCGVSFGSRRKFLRLIQRWQQLTTSVEPGRKFQRINGKPTGGKLRWHDITMISNVGASLTRLWLKYLCDRA